MRTVIRPRSLVLIAALCAIASAPPAAATERRTLREPAEIDGVPCAKVAWTDDDGRLEGCFLAREAVVAGHRLPHGTRVGFDPPGVLDCCFLAHDYEIQGHVCRGHGHGYQTCFHPDGQLEFCNLKEPEVIQGVPCDRSTFLTWVLKGPAGVTFHDNGRLKGCLLSEDLELQGHSLERGQRIELDPEGNVVTGTRGRR